MNGSTSPRSAMRGSKSSASPCVKYVGNGSEAVSGFLNIESLTKTKLPWGPGTCKKGNMRYIEYISELLRLSKICCDVRSYKSPGPSDIANSWLGLFGKPIHFSLCAAHHPCVQASSYFWRPESFQLLCYYICKASCHSIPYLYMLACTFLSEAWVYKLAMKVWIKCRPAWQILHGFNWAKILRWPHFHHPRKLMSIRGLLVLPWKAPITYIVKCTIYGPKWIK